MSNIPKQSYESNGLQIVFPKDFPFTQEVKHLADILEELAGNEKVQSIIVDYDERGNITLGILSPRCTLFSTGQFINKDFSNYKEVANKLLDEFFKQPEVESDKEQYTGKFMPIGKTISFNREWGHYRFSDEECDSLLHGDTISFMATTKEGKDMVFVGCLAQQQYEGYTYYGFKMTSRLPCSFSGHTFTEEEINTLLSMKILKITAKTKAGKTYYPTIKWNPKNLQAPIEFVNDN